jgi:hypothetical protein
MNKISTIEDAGGNIGVSTAVRKYMRKVNQNMAHMRNLELNEIIAADFSKATPVHRFKLKSEELAEIRKSGNMYYIAVIRGRGSSVAKYDIIVVQPTYKEPKDKEISKTRLQPGWGAI